MNSIDNKSMSYKEIQSYNFTKTQIKYFTTQFSNKVGYSPGDSLNSILSKIGGKLSVVDYNDCPSSPKFVVHDDGRFEITINNYLGWLSSRFRISLGLGYYVLHSGLGKYKSLKTQFDPNSKNRAHLEADIFAREFLMPSDIFKTLMETNNDNSLAAIFAVSPDTIKARRISINKYKGTL